MVPIKTAEKIILSLYPKMFGVARKRVQNDEDAKDLVQQTMYKIFRLLYQKKLIFKTKESISPYCIISLKNACVNHINYNIEHPVSLENELEFFSNLNPTDSLTIYNDIQNRLSKINSKYCYPFQLFQDGYSGKEVSEMLKIPSATVRTRIFVYKKEAMKILNEI